jgi:hypothetical protein
MILIIKAEGTVIYYINQEHLVGKALFLKAMNILLCKYKE